MTRSNYIWALLATFLAASFVCEAVENPNVSTSFKSSNTVPSQGQSRRTIAQPINRNSNDVVTGNVGGGRHFRGFVPYGSTYYSGANLNDSGTTSVNQFMRRSVNPVVSDRNPGQNRPYYQSSRTASSFRKKTGVTTSSASANMLTGRTSTSTYDLPPLTRSSMQAATDSIQRPLSSNNQELDMILSHQFKLNEAAQEERRNELAREVTTETTDQDRGEFESFFDNLPKQPEETDKQEPEIDETETKPETRPELDVLKAVQEDTQEAIMEQKSSRTSLRQQRLDEEAAQLQIDQPQEETTDENPTLPETTKTRLMEHAESAKIRGDHKTFESLAEAKFSAYMGAAERYVVEGKYYKAADAYDLAMVWMSEDPRPYAGKAFSLFAAGEYMSSAYYLIRTVELNPQLAAKPVNIARMLGDRDIYENRLLEISTWQQRSGAGELAFLMAYLYHHDGKPAKAETAITTATAAMPDNNAVNVLQNIISGSAK